MTKIAMVTGAGVGIGRAATLALSKAGYAVVLAGRRVEPLRETAKACVSETLVVPTDVTSPDAVRALFARTEERFGRLDILFNNAGIGAPPVEIDDLSDDHWHAVVNTNLNGMFYCLRAAFGLMKRQDPRGGRIVNNGSISADRPRPNSIAYTATKHAVSGLTKAASLDGRAWNIAVGQIDIGNAATEMTERMRAGIKQANGQIMVEPTFDVAHVGAAVVQMAELPLDTNIQFMTIMATTMPLVGRG
jgi:NAD(P)-dependent dehydrogenase (short-subunit alcohol dehydrogenase family)